MNATQSARLAHLLPGGVPRYVRCYEDDKSDSFDRYTVCFTGRAATEHGEDGSRHYSYVGLSGHGSTRGKPCDVNKSGFAPAMGRRNHIGRRVPFSALPIGLQRTALADYREIWRLK